MLRLKWRKSAPTSVVFFDFSSATFRAVDQCDEETVVEGERVEF